MHINAPPPQSQQGILTGLIILGIVAQFYLCVVPDFFIPNPAIYKSNLIISGIASLCWLLLCGWTYHHSTNFKSYLASYFSVNILRYFAILGYLAISLFLISFSVKGVESMWVKAQGQPTIQTVLAGKLQQRRSKGSGYSYFIVSPAFAGANRSGITIGRREYEKLPDKFTLKLIGVQNNLGFTVVSYHVI